MPASIGLALDGSVRLYRDGTVLVGGDPARVLRLTGAGRAAIGALLSGEDPGEAGRRLGRRVIDAGLAHPRPRPAGPCASVTVVIPTRDRPRALGRCLAAIGASTSVVVVDDGSRDDTATADVCRAHEARLVRHDRPGGAAAARNTGLAEVDTELVAFMDCDCIPTPGWLQTVAAHFVDPLVGAVAPRIVPAGVAASRPGRPSTLERYLAARSPLDMGDREGGVVPGGRIPYVPTATLVVRRRALEPAFDPDLRIGEDVDLVWRLHDAGWRVRYEPHATVHHAEPRSWRAVLRRRWRYGTSVAPLARRHPGRLAPLVAGPLPTATALLMLARRPLAASAMVALNAAVLAHHTRRAGAPPQIAIRWSVRWAGLTLVRCGHAATMLAFPAVLTALRRREWRLTACLLLLAAPVYEWVERRPSLDATRWTLACLVDDIACGLGVWSGCLRHRTADPLLPRLKAVE